MSTRTVALAFPGPRIVSPTMRPARVQLVPSTGTEPAGSPELAHHRLLFDPDTAEWWAWQFIVPSDFVNGLALNLLWGGLAVAGNVMWRAGVAMMHASATDGDVMVSDVVTDLAATSLPGTSGRIKSTPIPLTATAAAGEQGFVWLGRNAASGSDNALLDAFVMGAFLNYEDA